MPMKNGRQITDKLINLITEVKLYEAYFNA
jgi:hypothetical protein